MDPCVFCDIAEGRAEGSFVYRDDRVVAFMNIGPVMPGQLLVVPIAHLRYRQHRLVPPEAGACRARRAR